MNTYRPSNFIAGQLSVVRHPTQSQVVEPSKAQSNRILENVHQSPSSNELIGLAKALSTARWRRKDFLNANLFGEPGWDMLLALFFAEGKGQRLTVTDLCVASESPQSTALRWLDQLEKLELVWRERSRTDGRITYISLKPQAHKAIENYLCRIWNVLFFSQ